MVGNSDVKLFPTKPKLSETMGVALARGFGQGRVRQVQNGDKSRGWVPRTRQFARFQNTLQQDQEGKICSKQGDPANTFSATNGV